MTDWTTARVTPETLAELRRLLDCSSKLPWERYRPHFASGYHSITASDGQTVAVEAGEYDAELIAAAINALPALLDAAAERDALAADADRWQRAALTLQGEQEHAVDPRAELLAEELHNHGGCEEVWPSCSVSTVEHYRNDARDLLARLDAARADA